MLKDLFLGNHWANFNQFWYRASLRANEDALSEGDSRFNK